MNDYAHIVHRDAQILVLYKPSGIPTTSLVGGVCLVRQARALDPQAPGLHPMSRLDAEVSGLVTFARTRPAIRALLRARARGQYVRCYTALAVKAPEPARGVWDAPIAIDPRERRRRVAAGFAGPASGRGKPALTAYETASRLDGAAALILRPRTGRTHQLRAHAAAAGTPLLGDKHYGGPTRVVLADGRVLKVRRVMLHCFQLVMPDLVKGGRLTLTAEPPEDMSELWLALGGNPDALRPH